MKQVNIRLSDEMYNRLNKLAEKTGRTRSYYVKEAILEYMEDMEDTYLAISRIENPEGDLSLEEAKKELGLDDSDQ